MKPLFTTCSFGGFRSNRTEGDVTEYTSYTSPVKKHSTDTHPWTDRTEGWLASWMADGQTCPHKSHWDLYILIYLAQLCFCTLKCFMRQFMLVVPMLRYTRALSIVQETRKLALLFILCQFLWYWFVSKLCTADQRMCIGIELLSPCFLRGLSPLKITGPEEGPFLVSKTSELCWMAFEQRLAGQHHLRYSSEKSLLNRA